MSLERARELFFYDDEVGALRWKKSTTARIRVGEIAGCVSGGEYVRITADGKLYLAHRLTWFVVYGRWPTGIIDHRDLNKSRNKLSNLREATNGQNQCNAPLSRKNTSGVKGVHGDGDKWKVSVRHAGKNYHGGRFSSLEEAARVRFEMAEKLHSEFFRA